jgi:hypothetical protein
LTRAQGELGFECGNGRVILVFLTETTRGIHHGVCLNELSFPKKGKRTQKAGLERVEKREEKTQQMVERFGQGIA